MPGGAVSSTVNDPPEDSLGKRGNETALAELTLAQAADSKMRRAFMFNPVRLGVVALGVATGFLAGEVPMSAFAADAPTRMSSPADLALLRRIALADPETVPAGVYARSYLESIGLWPALKDRVIPTLNVRAALAAVESGNADAGLVYRTDAALSRRVRVAFTVTGERGPRIVYVLAPLAASRKPAALELARRLAGPEARTIFERYGFQVLASR